jgi:hypothetical protein
MSRRTALAFVALAVALAGTAAHAQSTLDSDIKCMVVGGALNQSQDPKARTVSTLMIFYFLGRIDARDPNLDLTTALKTRMQALKPADLQVEARRCSDQMNTRSQALQAVSAKLNGVTSANPAGANPAGASPTPKQTPATPPSASPAPTPKSAPH